MITAQDSQLAAFKQALPVNCTMLPATVMRDFRCTSEPVRAWHIAKDMAAALFACYRQTLKQPVHEVAIANSARRWLKDWVTLYNWLEAQSISPVLYLRAQVEILKRHVQPRALRNEKSLAIYFRWVEGVRLGVDTPGQAMKKLEKLERLQWRDPFQHFVSQAEAGKQYVHHATKVLGLSREAVICLESWHLPPAYFLADPVAFDLMEQGAVDDRIPAKVKNVAKELTMRGELDRFLQACV